jgi:hypothetical protein
LEFVPIKHNDDHRDAYTYANPDTYTYTYTNPNRDAYTNTNTHTHTNTNTNTHTHTNTHTNPDDTGCRLGDDFRDGTARRTADRDRDRYSSQRDSALPMAAR